MTYPPVAQMALKSAAQTLRLAAVGKLTRGDLRDQKIASETFEKVMGRPMAASEALQFVGR